MYNNVQCEYCGQYGEGKTNCKSCGAPIKPAVEKVEFSYRKLSRAIAYAMDSDSSPPLYFDTM